MRRDGDPQEQQPKLEQGQVDWPRNLETQEQHQQLKTRRWYTPGHGDQGGVTGGRDR